MGKSRANVFAALAGALMIAGHGALLRADDPPASFEPRSLRATLPPSPAGITTDFDALKYWQSWLDEHEIMTDRCGIEAGEHRLILELSSAEDLSLLESNGFLLEDFFVGEPADGAPRGSVDDQYFDPDEIAAMLTQIEIDHPGIARVFVVGMTIENRDILAIEISDHPGVDEDEPAVLLNGLHHAREVATPHIIMDAIDHLTDGYAANDPQIVAWVQNFKTICVPMVNPDGSARVFAGDIDHRKNVRGGCTTGSLNNGVDLNRNYPYHWGSGTSNCNRGTGSSGSICSDSYRGTAATSEPETQAMMSLADLFHFTVAVSYHSYGRFIDYPYACNDGNPDLRMPEHAVIDQMMRSMSTAIQGVNGISYAVNSPIAAGPVNGDDTSWYYAHKGTYPFIVEVGTAFQPPFSQVAGIVAENRAGWRSLYSRLEQARIDLHVHSQCQPLDAEVTLLNYTYDTDELPRFTTLPFGRWTYIVPPNAIYTVRISKPGYITQDVPVAVANVPVDVSVELLPVTAPAILHGDMNSDCIVDGRDISPFVSAYLSGEAAPIDQLLRADFSADCMVGEADVAPFVEAALNEAICP